MAACRHSDRKVKAVYGDGDGTEGCCEEDGLHAGTGVSRVERAGSVAGDDSDDEGSGEEDVVAALRCFRARSCPALETAFFAKNFKQICETF